LPPVDKICDVFFAKPNIKMNQFLYLIAVVLIIGWAVGYFMYSAGAIIHILLLLALMSVLLRVIQSSRLLK
jgi:hypothetical protein